MGLAAGKAMADANAVWLAFRCHLDGATRACAFVGSVTSHVFAIRASSVDVC